jgi:HECT-domain (ubiquitin-transferase)/SPRY domain
MICAFTLAGVLSDNPQTLQSVLSVSSTLTRFFGRLPSSVSRRVWAERAASPVCSRYAQSMIELLASVKRAVKLSTNLPAEFLTLWGKVEVDSATPIPFDSSIDLFTKTVSPCWEAREGFVSTDSAWEVWIGAVELLPVSWKPPNRSGVRNLVDAGQGPPRLDEGCTVLRGVDWNERCQNEDGHDRYEAEKAKYDKEKQAQDEQQIAQDPAADETSELQIDECVNPAAEADSENDTSDAGRTIAEEVNNKDTRKKKKQKLQPPKLALGTVLSVEPWDGVAGMARRVRWSLTGETGLYRYGGAGGKFDISHVETNSKGTRVKKRNALPESAEQCAARHGFGGKRKFGVLLRLLCNRIETEDGSYTRDGILEWPDFGAAAKASVTFSRDGSVLIKEEMLLFGSTDSGWEARFGQPSYEPGTEVLLKPPNPLCPEKQAVLDASSSTLSQYDEFIGHTSFEVKNIRDRASGSKVSVRSEMRIYRSRLPVSDGKAFVQSPPSAASSPLPLSFDKDYHAASISLSHDGRTASCTASDGRCTAFASLGFTKGVHYWEVKLEQADIGSVYVGVAEKPTGSVNGSSLGGDSPPRLNRWHGWGFVNFRATYTSGAERVYGAHCHSGDTVGVLLDCDAGRVSFFFDGLKYGEHIMNDLGCAFESLSPFGFNVDGCGSGGTGQGAPSGFEGARGGRQLAQGNVRPRTLWPVIGLRNQGDRVTLSAKWSTCYGVDSTAVLRNVLNVDEFLYHFTSSSGSSLQPGLLDEAYREYCSWNESTFARTVTRCSGQYPYTASGMSLILDATPQGCAAASAGLGLPHALLAGDRVRLTRSAGRILELAEEAVVLGSYQGRLYYRIVSQKSEGGSLTEGGGRAWFWDESEVVDGLPLVKPGLGLDVPLPRLDRFKCLSRGGLRVIYEGGAVLRSDLEIFDGSTNLGTAPPNTVFPQADVLERRVNSAGVVRYRVRYNDIEGWISARIRGSKDEMIVQPVDDSSNSGAPVDGESFPTALDCALKWHEDWKRKSTSISNVDEDLSTLCVNSRENFDALLLRGVVPGMTALESDALLSRALNAISNFTATGDAIECPFRIVCSALSCAIARSNGNQSVQLPGSTTTMVEAVNTIFATCPEPLPPLSSMMARIAVLMTFNRRLRLALPWLPLRPCQEGSAILGGQVGLGASVERAGRSHIYQLSNAWLQLPSIATRLRAVRSLVFTSVKREFLLSITESTTTPTPLSHDEYELPREIRTVRINRLKAARAMESDDAGAKRKCSVFAQLQGEIRSWVGAALRRGYVAKGHGGQKRAFKVKLVGEGVNDYSGPYREVFADAVSELTRSDPDGRGDLGVLDSTPNHVSGIGENRDLLMFSLNGRDLTHLQEKWSRSNASEWECLLRQNFASVVTPRDESSREVEEALVFLGRITGTAFRHGIPLDLPFPLNSVWKSLAEEWATEDEKLKELDYLAYRLRNIGNERDIQPLLQWQQRMLNSFAEGLSNVLPLEVFPLFTGEELRDTLCGNPEVDVDLLKRVVEYEGYDPEDLVIEYFWQTLREITNDERKQFLQFVWARNRLPIREADFEAPFKIQKDAVNSGDRADQALPSASTCFFSLTLPSYSCQEILKAKLLFAINNVTTMETDFQTNSAEISEGYRALS